VTLFLGENCDMHYIGQQSAVPIENIRAPSVHYLYHLCSEILDTDKDVIY